MSKKKNKGQVRRIAFLVALILGIAPIVHVSATTINDAQNKRDEAQNELNEVKNNISNIEKEQQELQEEIDALDAELVAVIMNLGILESDLDTAEAELIQVQADLEKAKLDEEEQYQAMKMRIRFMYERGDSALLTSILQSKSMADILNRVEYVNEVYDYDRQLLATFEATKLQVADLEVQVQSEIAELEELQANYEEEKQRYETIIAEKQSQMENFDTQLADARALANQYQDTIDRQNKIIREEEERRRREEEAQKNQNNQNNNSSSGGGKNPGYATDVSGSAVVDFACQFIGNPYEYGGTDINNGIDCSAFVQYVYRHFGISLPRTSGEQRRVGKEVSYANAQPGDIICYSGHVAIYMGNGKIVHASNSAPYPIGGIKTGNAAYRTILSVRRVL